MNKLAIFVEGQTELLFVDRLLNEIANENQLSVEFYNATGGATVPFKMTLLRSKVKHTACHYVQIVNCNSDGTVKSYIRERYQNLVNAGFWSIIGIRDAFPLSAPQVASLRSGLSNGMPTAPIQVHFILGVMEIEAWFLAEDTHFLKLHPSLTNKNISARIGFDPAVIDVQLRPNPAKDLHDIYQIVGLAYTKTHANCARTLQCLDYARVYCELPNRFPDLLNFMNIIDQFLALP